MTPLELYEAVGLTKKGKNKRMQRMGDAIVAEWAAKARQHGNMKSTLTAYNQAIAIRRVTKNSVTVELPGSKLEQKTGGKQVASIARMMEFGLGPGGIGSSGEFDVRRWLLTRESSGSKGKIQGKGRGVYRNVPFKHKVKSIAGLGGGSAVQAAKNLAATRVMGGSWNGPSLAAGYTAIVNNPNTGLPHKTDRLQGLRRMGKGGKTSRYITFRRASWNGNPWMHRGITARHIARLVVRDLDKIWARVA